MYHSKLLMNDLRVVGEGTGQESVYDWPRSRSMVCESRDDYDFKIGECGDRSIMQALGSSST